MTVRPMHPVDAFMLDKAAAVPEGEIFFQHYFKAVTYAFGPYSERRVFRCAECGQVRPWHPGDGTTWVEFGLCPAELERPPGWIRQQRSRVQEMQARIYRLQEVVNASWPVLSAYKQGTLAPNGVASSTMYSFEKALNDAGTSVHYGEDA